MSSYVRYLVNILSLKIYSNKNFKIRITPLNNCNQKTLRDVMVHRFAVLRVSEWLAQNERGGILNLLASSLYQDLTSVPSQAGSSSHLQLLL